MTKQELATTIWASANEMRSSKIEASEYKDYVLGFIFYKFLCEKEQKFVFSNDGTENDLKNTKEGTKEADFIAENIGYFIDYNNLFSTWRSSGKSFAVTNVSDALSAFNRNIYNDEKDKNKHLKKLFDGIFDILQAGLSKFGDDAASQTTAISKLLKLVDRIPMDDKQDYDVLGFVYEYLIGNFAANAGKKAGEFYTPHEVSVLMSEIVANHLKDHKEIKIYDSTSGSGSLLINIGKSVEKQLNDQNGIVYYAQELIPSTFNLTRMNLIMRGIAPGNIYARCGDTLEDDWPMFDDADKENTYEPLINIDAIVGNPPYSQKWERDKHENDKRYQGYGLAPATKADYAFLLHDLYHLRPGGIMTIVLPHGVLFRGNRDDGSEGSIRKNLIEKNNIDAIIGLPANIFYGTGIPTIIMVLKKGKTNDDVLIIDASKGFIKDGKKNRLRERDIKKIVDTYVGRLDIDGYSRKVSRDEIRDNDYNLNIPRYVDSGEKPEPYDLNALINGGIPKSEVNELSEEFSVFPSLPNELFIDNGSSYLSLKCSPNDVSNIIRNNADVKAYEQRFKSSFTGLPDYLYDELINKVDSVQVSAEDEKISEFLFKCLDGIKLIDKYQIYQILNDQWKSISDDIDTIQKEGLSCARDIVPIYETKKKGNEEKDVEVGEQGKIIPFSLIQETRFHDLVAQIKEKENRLSEIEDEYSNLIESISEEDKDSTDIINDDGTKFVMSEIKKDAKNYIKTGIEYPEDSLEYITIKVNTLGEEESQLKKSIKDLSALLDRKTHEAYTNLTDDDIREYLVKKWIDPLIDEIMQQPNKIIDELAERIIHLDRKYKTTLIDINSQIESTEEQLSEMIDDLVGDENDMKALEDLKMLLGKK